MDGREGRREEDGERKREREREKKRMFVKTRLGVVFVVWN